MNNAASIFSNVKEVKHVFEPIRFLKRAYIGSKLKLDNTMNSLAIQNASNNFKLDSSLTFLTILLYTNIPAFPRMAENTNTMQDIIQVDSAENPCTFGEIDISELNMLISTKNSVTSKVILSATI